MRTKLTIFATLVCLGVASSANADRGKNSDGKCVDECSRSGGRPCPPCPPSFDPEAVDNMEKIADFEILRGHIYFFSGDFKRALKHHLKGLNFYISKIC